MDWIRDLVEYLWTEAGKVGSVVWNTIVFFMSLLVIFATMTGDEWPAPQFFLSVLAFSLAYVLSKYVAGTLQGGLIKSMVSLLATFFAFSALATPCMVLLMTFRPIRIAVDIVGPHVRLETERQLVRSERVDILAQNEWAGQLAKIVRPAEVYQRDGTDETEVVLTGTTLPEGTVVFIDREEKCPPAYGRISPRGCIGIITRRDDGNLGSTRGFVDARTILHLGTEQLPGLDRKGNLVPRIEVTPDCKDLGPKELTNQFTWFVNSTTDKQTIHMEPEPRDTKMEICYSGKCVWVGGKDSVPGPYIPFAYRVADGKQATVCVTTTRIYTPG